MYHRDIAVAVQMALAGVMDGHTVNLIDDAPTSVYELVALAGASMEPAATPLSNPWHLHVDGSFARRLGFQPTVRTIYQAVQENLLSTERLSMHWIEISECPLLVKALWYAES